MSAKIEHKIINGVECKWCGSCKRWLPLSEFSKDKKRWDGLRDQCKQCRKQYYENNKEKKKQYRKQYRKNKREIIKQKFGDICYICGKRLFKKKGDFALHHATYESYLKNPLRPTRWNIPQLEKIDKEDFLLLCPTCHKLVHIFLNFQRWRRPCDFYCIIEKLIKLRKNGKLNWHHGEKK